MSLEDTEDSECEEDSQLRSLSLEDTTEDSDESEDSEEWVFFFKVKKNNKLSKSKLLKSLIPESLNKTETPKQARFDQEYVRQLFSRFRLPCRR